jgi:hypothetical protein
MVGYRQRKIRNGTITSIQELMVPAPGFLLMLLAVPGSSCH